MNTREQFEKESGEHAFVEDIECRCFNGKYVHWLEERADHDWQEFHEPLARIYREVQKALPFIKKHKKDNPDSIVHCAITDYEINTEIQNLIRTIIEEVENEGD